MKIMMMFDDDDDDGGYSLCVSLRFSQKKSHCKKERRKLIVRKRLTPLSLCCDSQRVKKEGKRCLCLFTLKRIKTDTRHTRINMNPE